MKRDEICKGCRTYTIKKEGRTFICGIPHRHGDTLCPCHICLVKPICITSCEDLIIYRKLSGQYCEPFSSNKETE